MIDQLAEERGGECLSYSVIPISNDLREENRLLIDRGIQEAL